MSEILDSSGFRVGTVKDDGQILDHNGMHAGRVEAGEVYDASGFRAGTIEDDGGIISSSGLREGFVRGDEVLDANGFRVGEIVGSATYEGGAALLLLLGSSYDAPDPPPESETSPLQHQPSVAPVAVSPAPRPAPQEGKSVPPAVTAVAARSATSTYRRSSNGPRYVLIALVTAICLLAWYGVTRQNAHLPSSPLSPSPPALAPQPLAPQAGAQEALARSAAAAERLQLVSVEGSGPVKIAKFTEPIVNDPQVDQAALVTDSRVIWVAREAFAHDLSGNAIYRAIRARHPNVMVFALGSNVEELPRPSNGQAFRASYPLMECRGCSILGFAEFRFTFRSTAFIGVEVASVEQGK